MYEETKWLEFFHTELNFHTFLSTFDACQLKIKKKPCHPAKINNKKQTRSFYCGVPTRLKVARWVIQKLPGTIADFLILLFLVVQWVGTAWKERSPANRLLLIISV